MSNIIFFISLFFPTRLVVHRKRERVEITIFIRYHFWWMLLCIWISCTMYTHIEIRHWLVSICKQTPKSIWQLQISRFYSYATVRTQELEGTTVLMMELCNWLEANRTNSKSGSDRFEHEYYIFPNTSSSSWILMSQYVWRILQAEKSEHKNFKTTTT